MCEHHSSEPPRPRWFVDRVLCAVALAFIRAYQRYLGWLLGGHCRFVPSCSCYGEEAFHRGPFHWALILTIWRLLRCQPFCRGGFDPVPDWMNAPPSAKQR
jgi:putative membrane protein insertion efficiency factor